MTDIFYALADPTRRELLDRMFGAGGLTLTQLCEDLPMSRQAVAKHLAVLEAAELVAVRWRGRSKHHYLNPVPLAKIVHRWVGKFEDVRIEALAGFAEDIENRDQDKEKRRA
ncbi:ArsR/SmtB family transcription factor [Qipengyuania marisflavi]|uniref:Helix-turn-helix transcriptional regulator n=1 Tax=Qipengyuania marisflavi TaxID=2486356 RepID=A0A5S3P6X1_9SPHN|nr:metalloregulator ArsR/SmtB family transcription factor [Qipengyuania marisflavi]TMM48988.1 helix-turn-helix transcriptional regulator [Qipengyuania marisflavi]